MEVYEDLYIIGYSQLIGNIFVYYIWLLSHRLFFHQEIVLGIYCMVRNSAQLINKRNHTTKKNHNQNQNEK